MKNLSLFLATIFVAVTAFAQSPDAVLTGDRTFQSLTAKAAQERYFETLQRARRSYAAGLEGGIKAAMAAGSLEDANSLTDLKKRLESGGMPETTGRSLKTAPANEARIRFETTVAEARREYAGELQRALKWRWQLDEANAINGELKGLGSTETALPVLGSATGRSAAGLLLTRYALHPSQAGGNKYAGYVPVADLGKPLGAAMTIPTISKWSKPVEENAVVTGLLRIDQPGTYEFRTDSGYDRNELLIDGKIVCKFRDGENRAATVELRAGLLPIVSVGYAHSTTQVRVQWKPPGAAEFGDIPAQLFSH